LPVSSAAFTEFSKAFGVKGYEYTNIKSLETAKGKFKNFHLWLPIPRTYVLPIQYYTWVTI